MERCLGTSVAECCGSYVSEIQASIVLHLMDGGDLALRIGRRHIAFETSNIHSPADSALLRASKRLASDRIHVDQTHFT